MNDYNMFLKEVKDLNREEILSTLLEHLQDGIWGIAILKREGVAINKEKLKDMVNEYYKEKNNVDINLINSRHSLDIFAARLEGAGLVNVSEVGRARVYTLSKLGQELIEFREQLRKKQ